MRQSTRNGLTYLGTAPLRRSRRGTAPEVDLSQLRFDPSFGDDLGDFADPYSNVDADVDGDVPGLDDADNDAADFGRRLTAAERKQMRQQRVAMRRRQRAQRQALNRKQRAQRQKIRRQTENSGATGMRWAKTVLVANQTVTNVFGAPGTFTQAFALTIRPQFNFKAMDLNFQGPLLGTGVGVAVAGNVTVTEAGITALNFGDQQVWSNAQPVPVNALVAASFLRNLVRGQRIKGGLDVTLNCTVTLTCTVADTGTATYAAVLVGWKQTRGYCP